MEDVEDMEDNRTMGTPEGGGSVARVSHYIRDLEGEERDKDGGAGVDDACLDADTSGDENKDMSISGDSPPDLAPPPPGTSPDNAAHQDSSMGAILDNSKKVLNL